MWNTRCSILLGGGEVKRTNGSVSAETTSRTKERGRESLHCCCFREGGGGTTHLALEAGSVNDAALRRAERRLDPIPSAAMVRPQGFATTLFSRGGSPALSARLSGAASPEAVL
mmetsp:Transcript_7899/g.19481  ORF Transcript_7899/g.19481 Transcript_7899/m.19481 type:complete len:114 (-) Transcript_7899:282-623(-)